MYELTKLFSRDRLRHFSKAFYAGGIHSITLGSNDAPTPFNFLLEELTLLRPKKQSCFTADLKEALETVQQLVLGSRGDNEVAQPGFQPSSTLPEQFFSCTLKICSGIGETGQRSLERVCSTRSDDATCAVSVWMDWQFPAS